MKINNINQGKIGGLRGEKDLRSEDVGSRREGAAVQRSTESDLSSVGRLASRARAEAEGIEDVRPDRIAEVQAKLEAGAYDTDEVKERVVAKLAERLRSLFGR